MTLALVMTAKNEAPFMEDNLRFHRHAGVTRVYLFDNGATDGTFDGLDALPGVAIAPSIRRPDQLPAWLTADPRAERIASQLDDHFVARQLAGYAVALEAAREAGCAWLLCIDPDELVCPDPMQMPPAGLRAFLDSVDDGVDMVRFMPLEAIPDRVESDRPILDARHFKNLWHVHGERWFPAHGHHFVDHFHDRYQGGEHPGPSFNGHTLGKVAIRTREMALPRTSHGFLGIGRTLKEQKARWLLHYVNYGLGPAVARLRSNYRAVPKTHLSGFTRARIPAQLCIEMANDPEVSDEELHAFYERSFVWSEARLAQVRASRPEAIVDVQATAAVLTG